MNLRNRVQKLEDCLLKPDFQPDLYDLIVEMDMRTIDVSKAEAIERIGDKEIWLNDRRVD